MSAGTKHRRFRIDDELWEAFSTATGTADTDRSTAIRAFMRWYAREPGAKLPTRPKDTTTP
jgi:hypothetical protein